MRSADPPLAGAATAASRCGPAHGQNEDRWVLLGADDLLLLAVADGMGGTAGGGTAAGLALQPLLELAAPGVGPTGPGVSPTAPSVGPTGSGVGPTAPSVGLTGSGVGPTAPSVGPTGPGVGPTGPGVGPTGPAAGNAGRPGPAVGPPGPAASPTGPAAGNVGPTGQAGRTGPAAEADRVERDESDDPDSTLEPPPPADPVSGADAPVPAPPAAADPAGEPGADPVDPATETPPALGGACRAVRAAMLRAHERVRAAAAPTLPSALRPGSTLTVALVLGDRLTVGHVGDSGCWLLRRGTLIRLTEVHTHAAVLVAAGAVDRDSAAARRLDNLLTRHLGMPGELRPQLVTARLRNGDRLLLASDGLYRTLSMPELAALLARPDTTADQLVDAAVAAGARDDVTALLATVGEAVSGYAAPVGTAAGGPAEPAPAGAAGRADLAAPDERPAASRPEAPRAAAGR
jgi:protein phosphatase